MKIQISPRKRIQDAMTIWHEPGEDVDICIDTREDKGLTFKPGSVKIIYAFGILGETKPKNVLKMLNNFFEVLAPDGQLYIIEHNFEYINRAIMGGDLSLNEFNASFRRDCYFDQFLLVSMLEKAGFPKKDQRIWTGENMKFSKQHYELIISGTKPKQ